MYVVVGLGYFGKIIKSKLKDDLVITVDPYNKDADYTCVEDVPVSDGYWFVVTPASTHYDVINRVINKGVQNIWVEKPICTNLEESKLILCRKPDIYCDYTWLKHPMVEILETYSDDINHLSLKWLNDGTHIPSDVSLVSDLVIHPLSIIVHILGMVFKHTVVFKNEATVIISGRAGVGTFTIEVSNESKTKYRSVAAYSKITTYRWSTADPLNIENHGIIPDVDAIEENIKAFKQGKVNTDISQILYDINESCK